MGGSMIIVTGGAGFIGSNLIKGLNQKGYTNILIVDDLKDGKKFTNIVNSQFIDYLDKDDFINKISTRYKFPTIEAIFHQGACSSTTEWDGKFLMENNYEYSKILLNYALENKIPFYYASSAAIYGANTNFQELPQNENPLNLYGFSKLLFDRYVRQFLNSAQSPIVGFRYFNVYGPNEVHKGGMVSVIQHFYNQLRAEGHIQIFNIPNYLPGEQKRDFVFVDDVVTANLWMLEHPQVRGIFNLGSGQSASFNSIAQALFAHCGTGKIIYEPLPPHLHGCYQGYTEADITELRKTGFNHNFISVADAVAKYLPSLQSCLSS